MRRVRGVLGRAAVMLVGAAAAARAGGYDHVLPEGTVVYLAIDDVDAFRQSAQASPLGRFLADESAAPMIDRLFGRFLALTQPGEAGGDFHPMQILGRVRGAVGLGFHSPVEDARALTVTLLADLGAPAAATVAELDRYVLALDGRPPTQELRAGVPVTLRVQERAGDGPIALRYGAFQNTLFVQISEQGPHDVATCEATLQRLTGEGGVTLENNLRYAGSLARSGSGVRVFVDLPQVVAMWDDYVGQTGGAGVAELDGLLGLSSLGALAGAVDLGPGGLQSMVRLDWGGQSPLARVAHGYLGAGALDLLSLVPAQVLSAAAFRLDLARGTEALLAVLAEQESLEVDVKTLFDDSLGFDPREVLFPLLSGQVALFSAEVGPAEAIPGFDGSQNAALLIGLQDGAQVEVLLDRWLREAGLLAARQRDEFRGMPVYTVPVFPLTVSYAVLDDLAVLSLSPTLLREVLQRRVDPELPALGRTEALAAALERVGGELSLVSFVEQATTMQTLVTSLCTLAAAGDLEAALAGLTAAPTWTPPGSVIQQYFGGATLFTLDVSASGITWHSLDLNL